MCHGKVKSRLKHRNYNQEIELQTSYVIENQIEYKGENLEFLENPPSTTTTNGRTAVMHQWWPDVEVSVQQNASAIPSDHLLRLPASQILVLYLLDRERYRIEASCTPNHICILSYPNYRFLDLSKSYLHYKFLDLSKSYLHLNKSYLHLNKSYLHLAGVILGKIFVTDVGLTGSAGLAGMFSAWAEMTWAEMTWAEMTWAYKISIQALNLRSNFVQEGEDDMNMEGQGHDHHGGLNSMDTTVLKGPMTKGKLRKLQEEVNKEMDLLKGQIWNIN
ncbi:hypothetical protein CR513_51510, partial [Mucuna pruriens]